MKTVTVMVPASASARPRFRPRFLRRLGERLLPESVTDSWYAADCPSDFDPRSAGIGSLVWARWRISCFLRGCPGTRGSAA